MGQGLKGKQLTDVLMPTLMLLRMQLCLYCDHACFSVTRGIRSVCVTSS